RAATRAAGYQWRTRMTSSSGPRLDAINWQKVRDRLARATEALETAQRLSPERARAVLEERARLAAQIPAQAPDAAQILDVVIFLLGDERYGVETRHVREVLRVKDYTPLPGTPAFLLGVFNLRGQIVPLIDLRTFFGITTHESTETTRVLVLGDER